MKFQMQFLQWGTTANSEQIIFYAKIILDWYIVSKYKVILFVDSCNISTHVWLDYFYLINDNDKISMVLYSIFKLITVYNILIDKHNEYIKNSTKLFYIYI